MPIHHSNSSALLEGFLSGVIGPFLTRPAGRSHRVYAGDGGTLAKSRVTHDELNQVAVAERDSCLDQHITLLKNVVGIPLTTQRKALVNASTRTLLCPPWTT